MSDSNDERMCDGNDERQDCEMGSKFLLIDIWTSS